MSVAAAAHAARKAKDKRRREAAHQNRFNETKKAYTLLFSGKKQQIFKVYISEPFDIGIKYIAAE